MTTLDLGFFGFPSSFGEDGCGELALADYSGTVYRIVPD
jgi:hypothetical protein